MWRIINETFGVISLFLLLFGLGATQPTYMYAQIHFVPGTTVEQASKLLHDIAIEKNDWEFGHYMGFAGTGMYIPFNTTDFTKAYNENWQQLWLHEKDEPASLRKFFAEFGIKHPNSLKQINDTELYIKWLETNIVGCWTNSTCPPVEITNYHTILTAENFEAIQRSPIVESVEKPSDLVSSAVFFWANLTMTTNLRLNQLK